MFFTSADNLAGLNTLGKDDQVLLEKLKLMKYSVFSKVFTKATPGHAEERTSQDEEEG